MGKWRTDRRAASLEGRLPNRAVGKGVRVREFARA